MIRASCDPLQVVMVHRKAITAQQPTNKMNCENVELCIGKVRYLHRGAETQPSNVYTDNLSLVTG